MEVRATRAGEGPRLREIRLAALLDAPYAFAAHHHQDAARPPEDWEQRASGSPRDAVFVAEHAGEWIGMAGGFMPEDFPGTVRVWGMWVAPEGRGRGAGAALLEAVVGWARARGAERVDLAVTDRAPAAAALYARAGFAPTGVSGPMGGKPELQQRWLELRLGERAGASGA